MTAADRPQRERRAAQTYLVEFASALDVAKIYGPKKLHKKKASKKVKSDSKQTNTTKRQSAKKSPKHELKLSQKARARKLPASSKGKHQTVVSKKQKTLAPAKKSVSKKRVLQPKRSPAKQPAAGPSKKVAHAKQVVGLPAPRKSAPSAVAAEIAAPALTVMTLTGKRIRVPIPSPQFTLKQLMEAVEGQEGIPQQNQRIIFQGKVLVNEDEPLIRHGVQGDSTVYLILKLR